MERQARKWNKILVNYFSVKELVSWIYKELSKHENTNNPIKIGKDLNKYFNKENKPK